MPVHMSIKPLQGHTSQLSLGAGHNYIGHNYIGHNYIHRSYLWAQVGWAPAVENGGRNEGSARATHLGCNGQPHTVPSTDPPLYRLHLGIAGGVSSVHAWTCWHSLEPSRRELSIGAVTYAQRVSVRMSVHTLQCACLSTCPILAAVAAAVRRWAVPAFFFESGGAALANRKE